MDHGAAETDAITRTQRINERIDTSKPHPARVYDIFLGGRDNYPADRVAAKAALTVNPRGYLNIWHNRDFMRRAVAHLTEDVGIRQFLDIGTGLPTVENVHEIAQRIAPQSRVVYVDNDPIVLAHARALLASNHAGATDYLDADLSDPETILRVAANTLDFNQPIALTLVAILHFIRDEVAYDVVGRLAAALPSGSALVLSHLTLDLNPEPGRRVSTTYRDQGLEFVLRSKKEFQRFFDDNGFELIEPYIVPVHRWRPDHRPWPLSIRRPIETDLLNQLDPIDLIRYQDINDVTDADVNVYGAVGIKP